MPHNEMNANPVPLIPTPTQPSLTSALRTRSLVVCVLSPCSLFTGCVERTGTEFTRNARPPALLSRLVTREMNEEGCLGFPKVVFGKIEREQFS